MVIFLSAEIILVETMTQYNIPYWLLSIWLFDVLFYAQFVTILLASVIHFFLSASTCREVLDSPMFLKLLVDITQVDSGIPMTLEMALYPLKILRFQIIALLMSSDSSFVFTIVTREQVIPGVFLKQRSHHLFLFYVTWAVRIYDSGLSFVIYQVCQNVFPF